MSKWGSGDSEQCKTSWEFPWLVKGRGGRLELGSLHHADLRIHMFILCKWSYGIEMHRCWNPLRGIAPQKTFRFNMRKAFQSDCECSCVSSRVILVLSYFPRSSSSRRYDAQIGSCKRTILFLGWLRALSRVLGSHCIITLLWLTDYVGKHLKTFAQSGWLYASILPGFDKSSWIVYTVYLCGYPAIAICLH